MLFKFFFTPIMGNFIATIELTTTKGETYHLLSSVEKTRSAIIDKAFALFRQEELIPNN
jgi:hypothetical protein